MKNTAVNSYRLVSRFVFLGTVIGVLTGLVVMTPATRAWCGSYIFADNYPNIHIITHPTGYTGTGGVLTITVGINPSSDFADEMVIPVQNMIKVFNALQPTNGNLKSGGNNNIPSGEVDFESVALHEFGHALGMGHPNLATESGLTGDDQNYTKSTQGPNTTWNLNLGSDGVRGSSDDLRGDDINLNWFRKSNNNPFTIAGTVDSSTYSRELSDLPSGHTYAANADRSVGELLGFPNSEAVMQQGSYTDEDQRLLGPEDVACMKYAMAGVDETSGNGDDYTIVLSYAGKTTSANIVFQFDNSQTGFAVTYTNGTFISTNHIAVISANVYFNTEYAWFFNDVPYTTAGGTNFGPMQLLLLGD